MRKNKERRVGVRVDAEDLRTLKDGVKAMRQLRGDASTASIKNASDFVRAAVARLASEARAALAEQQHQDALNAHAE